MKATAICLALIASASAAEAGTRKETIEYGCNDLVVLGRVISVVYSADIPDEQRCIYLTENECTTWNARYDLEISVERVIVGDESRSVLPAHYIAHGQIRGDVDFIFVLRPTDESYYLEQAFIQEDGYETEVAESCSSRP